MDGEAGLLTWKGVKDQGVDGVRLAWNVQSLRLRDGRRYGGMSKVVLGVNG